MNSALIALCDAEKLVLLQRLDRFREWHSLDEKRYCLVCGNLITGREIQITGNNSDPLSLQAICPIPNCHSIPMDWVLPREEILDTLSTIRNGPMAYPPELRSRQSWTDPSSYSNWFTSQNRKPIAPRR